MKYGFFFLTLAFFCSCTGGAKDLRTNTSPIPLPSPLPSTAPQPNKKFVFGTSIGNVELGNDCIWFHIQNPHLSPGDEVQVVFSDLLSKQEAFIAKISKDTICENHDKDPWPPLSGNDENKHMSKYRLDIDNNTYPRGYGFGVIHSFNTINVTDGLASADLNGDGKPEFFRDCTSNEGAHLTIWTGKPLAGRRMWHTYYHFPYDTEPTCSKKDYQ
jgi:hypothetical protein